MALTATVLGASGYSGGELLRILEGHPAIALSAASGGTTAGERLASVQPHLLGSNNLELLTLEEVAGVPADVCFSCLPSGSLTAHLADVGAATVVDLSDDHRAHEGWTYGLTELAREELSGSARIANPGCYPTAAVLCLAPFARARLLEGPVIIDAISGASGAGRRPEDRLLFAALAGSAMAYGTTQHRHVPEIERALLRFTGLDARVSFTPHLAPMARGLLVTARSRLARTVRDDEALALLQDAYASEPFVHPTAEWPATKPVLGSNAAHVSARVDSRNGLLICSAAIDNLGKGAAGQAVQNANVALGIDETTGLGGLGIWP